MRKLVLFSTCALAALVLTAAPAGAAAPSATLCAGWDTTGTSFDSVSALTHVASTARSAAGTVREPSLNATYEALPASAQGKGGAKFSATVPVWFHVVTDGTIGNVTQAQIDEQMTVLKLAFAGF